MSRARCVFAAVLAASAPALADEPPTHTVGDPTYQANYASPDRPIVVATTGERSTRNIAIAASIAVAGAALAGVGLYYNLDSRTKANSVAADEPTGQPWTASDQAILDGAHSSGVKAGVFYGIGCAALVGAVVFWIATAPSEQQIVIHPHSIPTVTPTPGGSLLGGAWRF